MEFLKQYLGEELYAQVVDKLKGHGSEIKLGNLAKGEYVAKAKYDKDLQDKDSKIKELTDQVKGFDGVDVKGLQTQVKDWETKYNADMAQAKIDSAVALALAKSGTKSEKALRGLLDMSAVKLDKDGNLTGLDDQLATIKKENDFLFEPVTPPGGKGGKADVELGGNHDGGSGGKSQEPMSIYDAVNAYYDK